ncbi:syndecan-4 isoform X2 [Fundulus heteroclitus]|uniref:syndecan-4 isoform X2 n=1 Tax=Fundulus heteroclitus TaxID=8078 RepID=UPI00165C2AB1|nr:syndecan-4 isoform X2 [Fundulus heteroclitus]
MIFPLSLVLMLSAAVLSESVRETETWVPMSTTQTAAMLTGGTDPEASGDSRTGSDFGFSDDDEDDDDDYDVDYEASGSGAGGTESTAGDSRPSSKPDMDNQLPDLQRPVRPTVDEVDLVQNRNEIPALGTGLGPKDQNPSNVLMSQATGDSVFNSTEVLAAVIAGCAVFLLFALLLILLLIYRMKKKDEGSYDLGKKPIYKKAPTTEIYA